MTVVPEEPHPIDEACRAQWPIRFRLKGIDGARIDGYCAGQCRDGDSVQLDQCIVFFYRDGYCDGTTFAKSILVGTAGAASMREAQAFGNAITKLSFEVLEMNGQPWAERENAGGAAHE